VNDGLIDINGNELLPALYYEIIIIPDNDNKLTIWLKKEEKNNEWLIYDQDSNKIRKATENDFLEN
jgi:uncharacterized protein (DUF2344 family)